MIKAFLNYNPVGQSLLVLEEEGKAPQEMTIHTDSGITIVEAVCSVMASAGVDNLFCNKASMGLATTIKQYVLTEYNNTTLDIQEYKGD